MESGTRLGRYEIQEQLGAGGMGEVYLAEDTRLHRKVAIKVLPEQFANDSGRLARFEQEARAAASLNHPNIAAVFDVGHEDGTHFMVQEFLEGQSLREVLRDDPPTLERALTIGAEIAEAVATAHQVGIVHRDIKPASPIRVTPRCSTSGSPRFPDWKMRGRPAAQAPTLTIGRRTRQLRWLPSFRTP